MIERIFVGWERPALRATVDLLKDRYGCGGVWDLTTVLLVVPGAQAGRRLRQIIEDTAARDGAATVGGLEDPVTPGDLWERLYRPQVPNASPMQARFAWMQAVHRLYGSPGTREHVLALMPKATDPSSVLTWAGVAEEGRRRRDAAAAEYLSLADLADRGAEKAGHRDDRRWEALRHLEAAYRAVLADAGLGDRDDARRAALARGEVACDRAIFLVGTPDLNGLERAMLRALSSPVCALVAAPTGEEAGFDDTGGLRAEYWHDRPIPIPDECLHFVAGPAEETNEIADRIAALDGAYARDEITVGVGDESEAEQLGRRLGVSGLPVSSPFGRPLSRVGPGALLSAVRDYLHDPSVRHFASLVRHPDLERRLSPLTEMTDGPLLSCLDLYLSECLPARLPNPDEAAQAPSQTPPSALDIARSRALAARDQIETLLGPLRGNHQSLGRWAGPVAGLLQTVYGAVALRSDTADERQFRRGVARLADILHEMRQLPTALAPTVSGAEALAFVIAEAEKIRLPSDADAPGMEMMGWLELALDDAPVLLLTGLHEGSVPAGPGDDALLPDSLRREWGLADDRRRRARDGFLLRVLLESRERVHCIVARRGPDGDPKMPSRLLFACDGPTAARRAQRFAARPEDAPPTRPLFSPTGERRLPPPRPEPPATEMHTLKVTAFRDYLACPYRFYLRYVLGLGEAGDGRDEMDPRAFGNLLHPCLEGFARSHVADSTDPAQIAAWLRDALGRECARKFGARLTPPLRLQARQAARRLSAFAGWQAQSARDGWQIQNDLTERELEAALDVDGRPFVLRGRLDRVDYHPATDRFRVMDYKTGDAGTPPEAKHRSVKPGDTQRVWTDLQLPLYRTLLTAQGFPEDRIEVGYVLLASDLNPVTVSANGKASGGTGFSGVSWADEDYHSARACAEDVVRKLRAGVFWPPSEPPRFTDSFSGLCLDTCPDRVDWFDATGETAA